jgi:hypothetical protein
VYINNTGTFDKTSGAIRSNTASGGATNGNAVMLVKGSSYYRNADLLAGDNISTGNLTTGWGQ